MKADLEKSHAQLNAAEQLVEENKKSEELKVEQKQLKQDLAGPKPEMSVEKAAVAEKEKKLKEINEQLEKIELKKLEIYSTRLAA